jgi:hypothetical protein
MERKKEEASRRKRQQENVNILSTLQKQKQELRVRNLSLVRLSFCVLEASRRVTTGSTSIMLSQITGLLLTGLLYWGS